MNSVIESQTKCYHCQSNCLAEVVHFDEKDFCCNGCKTVYEILESNNLCNYYDFEERSTERPRSKQFEFLEHPEIQAQLIDFKNDEICKITFYVPAIHCSSCLYLLENLYKIDNDIVNSTVNFPEKTVSVTFRIANTDGVGKMTVRNLVELLTMIGYEPLLNFFQDKEKTNNDNALLKKIALAGFCASNIMLFSFPEYLGLNDEFYQQKFGILSLILTIPVLLYSASEYYVSVWKSLSNKYLNIDFPILLGILIAFSRGAYLVLAEGKGGYFDSLTGLIFLLLIGKWFQQKTFSILSFDRKYKSFFPLSVTVIKNHTEVFHTVEELKPSDRIVLKYGDIFPADAIVFKGIAKVDYSFVTGEPNIQTKFTGDFVYAGGKHFGERIEVELLKDVSSSYLTQLWNNAAFQKDVHATSIKTFADLVGKYFTISILIISALTAVFWLQNDSAKIWSSVTAILIIACPCALSLSYPIILGKVLRRFGNQGLYLKNASIVENLANCDTIVFDKTGTLTDSNRQVAHQYFKRPLTLLQQSMVAAAVSHSHHPAALALGNLFKNTLGIQVADFKETVGAGIEANYESVSIKIGSALFLLGNDEKQSETTIHIVINETYKGYVVFENSYRERIGSTLEELAGKYELHLLTGDANNDTSILGKWFEESNIQFGCKPQQKLDYVKQLQAQHKKVIMLGDGLNDAGALKQADVGIAITEHTLNFTPSSDVILQSTQLVNLDTYLKFTQYALKLIKFSFGVSLIYNLIGLSIAVTGNLSPIVAAILMPLSSTTMLLIAHLGLKYNFVKQ